MNGEVGMPSSEKGKGPPQTAAEESYQEGQERDGRWAEAEGVQEPPCSVPGTLKGDAPTAKTNTPTSGILAVHFQMS